MNLINSVLCDKLGGLLCNLKIAVMLADLIFTMTANAHSPKSVLKYMWCTAFRALQHSLVK